MLRLRSAVAVLGWLLRSSWSAELAVEPDAHPEAALQACVGWSSLRGQGLLPRLSS